MDSFGGTVVDSMSTMLVMDLANSPEYKRALDHVANLTFSHTSEGSSEGVVSIFELTIRFVES
jgi:mannosyl-oligosaccharide alpha-1,2-mannosidase